MNLADQLSSAGTAGAAILLAGLISSRCIGGTGLTTLLASMGASAVILFAVPSSPMAKSWPLIGGHLLSAAIGVACAQFLPAGWLAPAVAVALSLTAMHFGRCLHPPGGATTLIPVLGGADVHSLGFAFLLKPVALNVAALWLTSMAFKALRRSQAPTAALRGDELPPLERLGIRSDDLHGALQDLHAVVDVSEDELNRIYNLAANRAFQREFGALTCAAIMSRDVHTAEFGDELELAWQRMQTRHHRALPVIDRARRVVGIVSVSDFFRHAGAERIDGLGQRVRRLIRRTPDVYSSKPEVVGQIMTSPAITARVDSAIAPLAQRLTELGIHQIPIVDEHDKLVGLITQTDLIAALFRILTAAASTGLPEQPPRY